MSLVPGLKLNPTAKFATLDLASVKVSHLKAAEDAGKGREKTRLNTESGPKVAVGVKIGGDFTLQKNPPFLASRGQIFDKIKARRSEEFKAAVSEAISVTLPDGKVFEGKAWETTPMDVALSISKGLAQNSLVAKVAYSSRVQAPFEGEICQDDGMGDEMDDEFESAAQGAESGELWDMTRPLEGSCVLGLLKFEDEEGKMVFWHSAAHVLGSCLERTFGSFLTIGPPVMNGFYYDSYMGSEGAIKEGEIKEIDGEFGKCVKEKQSFERLVVTKEEALELFAYNPFKSQLIAAKVPEGSRTTVYRNGDLVDLCRGPHVPNTSFLKAFAVMRNSATNWLGDTNNDSLQRVYATAFPDKKLLKAYQENLKKAEERDHRKLGRQQKLFLFHELSPGSAFWLPHGTRVYNTLIDFIKTQLWEREYTEVITPNMYNSKLWETSGHWQHYADSMFSFEVEKETFALKPMNCPGHCVMFASELRSYRDLPMRYADFGVLHRNELSGSLGGLTRVRRFQQDDGHIFCRKDQIKDEIVGALEFMKYVYDTFGMSYKLELSTRPKKALGAVAVWNEAEAQLAQAMNEFSGEGSWKINPGDGAFYGPKIDIKVMDAMGRIHQCATIQLDFQLPIRFDLKFKTAGSPSEAAAAGAVPEVCGGAVQGQNEQGYEKPIIIHRAMLGSVERMAAVLIEHFGGKWPFWLSPRQCFVVPVKDTVNGYAHAVGASVRKAGFFVEVDTSGSTMQKKVREGQLAQFNFILVVGEKEQADGTVNVRLRNNSVLGVKSVPEVLAMFQELKESHAMPEGEDEEAEKEAAAAASAKGKAAPKGGGKAPKQPKEKAAK